MKRALLVLLFVAGLVASLDSVSAGFCPRCGVYQNSDLAFGIGPTCTAAMQDSYDRAAESISCEYGTCYEEFMVFATCAEDGFGNWQMTGYIRYRCALDTSACIEP